MPPRSHSRSFLSQQLRPTRNALVATGAMLSRPTNANKRLQGLSRAAKACHPEVTRGRFFRSSYDQQGTHSSRRVPCFRGPRTRTNVSKVYLGPRKHATQKSLAVVPSRSSYDQRTRRDGCHAFAAHERE